jgi:hypothetical protein
MSNILHLLFPDSSCLDWDSMITMMDDAVKDPGGVLPHYDSVAVYKHTR